MRIADHSFIRPDLTGKMIIAWLLLLTCMQMDTLGYISAYHINTSLLEIERSGFPILLDSIGMGIVHDIQLDNFKLIALYRCMLFACGREFSMYYFDNVDHSSTMAYSHWLKHADPKTMSEFWITREDVVNLRKGRIEFNRLCMEEAGPSHTCKFQKLALSARIHLDLLDPADLDRFMSLVYFAERCFNNQLYDHAEALAYFLTFLNSSATYHFTDYFQRNGRTDLIGIYSSILTTGGCNESTHGTWDAAFVVQFTSLFTILAEVAKVKGQLDRATLITSMLVHSYQIHSLLPSSDETQSVSTARRKSLFYRLRILLTIPNVPVDSSAAKEDRARMIRDLQAFEDDIKRQRDSISLQVLYTTLPLPSYKCS